MRATVAGLLLLSGTAGVCMGADTRQAELSITDLLESVRSDDCLTSAQKSNISFMVENKAGLFLRTTLRELRPGKDIQKGLHTELNAWAKKTEDAVLAEAQRRISKTCERLQRVLSADIKSKL